MNRQHESFEEEKLFSVPVQPNTPNGRNFLPEGIDEDIVIPKPFFIHPSGHLYMTVKKNAKTSESGKTEIEQKRVSVHIPIITRRLSELESNNDYVEISWRDDDETKTTIESSAVLGRKQDLMSLATYGLDIREDNYKLIMKFFEEYWVENYKKKQHMTQKLGWVKGKFIHPQFDTAQGIVIDTRGEGIKEITESFNEMGTVDSWIKEVYEVIKIHPKALFMTVSSFSTVLLKELKLPSFIIEVAGYTSQGKTTATKTAASVWGDPELYPKPWNTTQVGIERMAGFLNSFPLVLDDTQDAKEYILKDVAYHFSQNKGKARGDQTKGLQKQEYWNTILLSNGEKSLLDFTDQNGVSARVVMLGDAPFTMPDADSLTGRRPLVHKEWTQIYNGIQNNYGVIGRTFLENWFAFSTEEKKKWINRFHEIRDTYSLKVDGDGVLLRLATSYALVDFTAELLNDMFNLDINTKEFQNLFLIQTKENTDANDRPKYHIKRMLEELDRKRYKHILFDTGNFPDDIKAAVKDNEIYLAVGYVNEFLQKDSNTIRKQWLEKRYTVNMSKNPKKPVDSKLISVRNEKLNLIKINPELVQELGFDFSKDTSREFEIAPYPDYKNQ